MFEILKKLEIPKEAPPIIAGPAISRIKFSISPDDSPSVGEQTKNNLRLLLRPDTEHQGDKQSDADWDSDCSTAADYSFDYSFQIIQNIFHFLGGISIFRWNFHCYSRAVNG